MSMTQVPLLFRINVKNTFIEEASLASDVDLVKALKRHASEPALSTPADTSTYEINWFHGQNRSKADALDALVSSGKNHVHPSLAPTTAGSLEDFLSGGEEEEESEDTETASTVTDLDHTLALTSLMPAPASPSTERWADSPMYDQPSNSDVHEEFGAFSEEELVSAQRVVGQPPVQLFFSHGMPKPPQWTNISTVMLRNLPNKVTQSALLLEMQHACFQNTYDFVHIPVDSVTKANRGYAFINFINADWAFAFMMQFEGRKFANAQSGKVMSVVPADIQGFEANYIRYWKNSSVRDDLVGPRSVRKPAGLKPTGAGLKPAGGKKSVSQHRGTSLIDLAAAQMATEQNMKQWGPATAAFNGTASVNAQKGASGPRPAQQFCTSCGGSCLPNFKFCKFCGAPVCTQR